MDWHLVTETPLLLTVLLLLVLAIMFQAIEDHALLRVRARPELEEDRANEPDSFVTGIVFQKSAPPSPLGGKGKQFEIDLSG